MTTKHKKIIAAEFVSLDRVMEAPDTWHFPYVDDHAAAVIGSQMAQWDGLLLGRRT